MKKTLNFLLCAAICALVLAACSDGTVPATPQGSMTLPVITTAAPETKAPETTAPIEEAESQIHETPEKLIASIEGTFSTAVEVWKAENSYSEKPLAKMMNGLSFDTLKYNFGEVEMNGTDAATVSLTVSYLDQNALFEAYMAALEGENGEKLDDEDGEIFKSVAVAENFTITVTETLLISKIENGWFFPSEGNIDLNEYLPYFLVQSTPIY